MDKLLEVAGISKESLNANQLIIVKTGECLYLCEDGKIQEKISPVYIGENGATSNKVEGDKCTPYGLYDMGFAFGLEDLIIEYPYRKITENSYWVDDVDSEEYNRWVELQGEKTWKSAEHMIDFPIQYKYGIVIEYNTKNPIPGKGSAIFLHVAKNPYTAGCVAVEEKDMLKILNWIKNAQILII